MWSAGRFSHLEPFPTRINSHFFLFYSLQYNSIRRSSIEFHSFEDSWMPGLHNTGSLNQGFPETPQQSSPPADSFIANTNRGEITSMAF